MLGLVELAALNRPNVAPKAVEPLRDGPLIIQITNHKRPGVSYYDIHTRQIVTDPNACRGTENVHETEAVVNELRPLFHLDDVIAIAERPT